jgi:hypothetical protein
MTEAEARRARAQQELEDLAAGDGESAALIDLEQLRQRFGAFSDIPAQISRLRHDVASLNLEIEALAANVKALDPSPGPVEALRALPLPDGAAIAKHIRIAELNESEEKRLRESLDVVDKTIAATEAELARLSSAGPVPTRTDLVHARRKRDMDLDDLRIVLDSDLVSRTARLSDVARSSRTIDEITDLLLTDSGRAARQENAQQRIMADRAEQERIAVKLADHLELVAEAASAWAQQWGPSGLCPRTPAEMQRWRERLDDILNRFEKCSARKVGIDALAATLDSGKAAVIAFLESTGRSPDRSLTLDILFHEARARLDEVQTAWANARTRSVSKQRIERDLKEADVAHGTAQSGLADLDQAWPQAMMDIGLILSTTPVQAEEALAIWRSVAVPKVTFEREGRSVETINADLQAFDNDVFEIVNRIAPQLRKEAAQDTLTGLSAALADMRNASESERR